MIANANSQNKRAAVENRFQGNAIPLPHDFLGV